MARTESDRTQTTWQMPLTVLLTAAGVVISYILTRNYYLHVVAGQATACSISAYVDCDRVSASAFSTLAGVPISVIALGFHAVLLILTIIRGLAPQETGAGLGALVLVLSAAGTAVSLVLAILAVFVVQALCLYCLALQVTTLAVLLLQTAEGGPLVKRLLSLGDGLRDGRAPVMVLIAMVVGVLAAVTVSAQTEAIGVQRLAESRLTRSAPSAVAQLMSRYFTGSTFQFDLSDAPVRGTPDRIQLVVFEDFNCPHCQEFDPDALALADEFSGSLQLVFKFFPLGAACNPLVQGGFPNSCQAAAAAYMAHQSDRFWEYSELLFTNFQQTETETLVGHARSVGLTDLTAFRAGLTDDSIYQRLGRDVREGLAAGVRGTPAVFLNGRQLDLSRFAATDTRYTVLRAAIQQLLSGTS